MSEIEVGLEGAPPEMNVGQGNSEALKYGKLWEMKEYRQIAPGEDLAQVFLAQARPKKGASVIDFGCGTGRGALQLALFGGLNVTMVDFVRNCLDLDIRNMLEAQSHTLRFIKADLERPLPIAAQYGYCTDVMEHIPPDKVEQVLNNILLAAQHVFFSISTVPDSCGKLIHEELHLSVHPFEWWLAEFQRRGCVVHWSHDAGQAALFYLSAWLKGTDITGANAPLNVEEQQVRDQVAINTDPALGFRQVMPHETNDIEVAILGGGPSLKEFEDEIREKKADGVKLVTLNGAYNWALEHDLAPVTSIIVDARAFNARFVHPVREDCLYLMASQVHPDVLRDLPKERTLLWHSDTDMNRETLDKNYERWWTVPGGSTVLLRAIPLLRMLGFRKFHLYGCDSCISADEHHAYSQPENDGAVIIPVVVNAEGKFSKMEDSMESGRVFYCHAWMLSQAQEMIDLIKFLGDEIELAIHGDGLLAHILKIGAEAQDALA